MSYPRFRSLAALLFSLLIALMLAADMRAEVTLAKMFSDHMVLQRDQAVPVWGWAAAGEEITVEFAGQKKSSITAADGKWSLTLDPLAASSEPRDLIVTSNHKSKIQNLKLSDVLVGEVWLASGQSNMHLNLLQMRNNEEVLAQSDDPWIRQFTVVRNDKVKSAQELAGVWRTANRGNLTASRTDGDSAVAYFFSRELRKRLNVPVGVLHASVGATPIENWLPGGKGFMSMIEPMASFGIRGAIWYQGESNLERSQTGQYAEQLTKLVAAWRSLWAQGEFPFFYVHLAPFRYSLKKVGPLKDKPVGPLELPLFWEAQAAALKTIPNSGLAVIHDSVTDFDNIHPPDKQKPGERLALLALAKTYGMKDVVCEGPVYREMSIEGGTIRVKFAHAGAGLKTRDGKAPTFVEIAGENRQFVPTDAVVEGDSLLVRHPSIPKPDAVRLGWNENAQPNLINQEGLPVRPFRTDDWPVK